MTAARNRSGRTLLNWGASIGFTVVTTVVALVSTPILLRFLGDERMGSWRALLEVTTYIALADIGMSNATAIAITRARNSPVPNALNETFFSAQRTHIRLLAWVLPAALGLAVATPWFIDVSSDLRGEFAVAAVVLVTGTVAYPLNPATFALEAAHQRYITSAIQIAQSVVTTIACVGFASLGWGLVGQAGATAGSGVIAAVVIWAFAIRRLSLRRPESVDAIPIPTLWPHARAMFANAFARRVQLMSDSAMVAVVLAPATVTSMVITQRLVALATSQVNAISNASWPAIQEIAAAGQTSLLEERLGDILRLVTGLGLTGGAAALALNSGFVHLWVGSGYYDGLLLGLLTLVNLVVVGVAISLGWLLDMGGHPQDRTRPALAAAVCKLSLAYPAMRFFGPEGLLACGAFATAAFEIAPYIERIRERHGVRPSHLRRRLLSGTMRGLPMVGLAWFVEPWVSSMPFGPFTVIVGVVGAVSALYVWGVVMNPRERALILGRLRGRT